MVESFHIPRPLSDEALRLLTSLPMKEIERRLLAPIPAPIPVSERLPGPKDCDAESCCWRWNTIGRLWTRQQYARKWYEFHSHWLPAHALPLPEVE